MPLYYVFYLKSYIGFYWSKKRNYGLYQKDFITLSDW